MKLVGTTVVCVLVAFGAAFGVARSADHHSTKALTTPAKKLPKVDIPGLPQQSDTKLAAQFAPQLTTLKLIAVKHHKHHTAAPAVTPAYDSASTSSSSTSSTSVTPVSSPAPSEPVASSPSPSSSSSSSNSTPSSGTGVTSVGGGSAHHSGGSGKTTIGG